MDFGASLQARIRVSAFLTLVGVLPLCVSLSTRCSAQDLSSPKRVLILYSFNNDQGLYSGFDRVLRSELRMRVKDRLEFYTEYLDLIRFPEEAHADEMVQLLKLKYAQKKPDLLIPVSYSALQFLTRKGNDIFPTIPMVALFNKRRLDDLKQYIESNPGQSITGVGSIDDPASTLGLALQLQPDTRHVAVLVGSSPLEHYWLDQLQRDLGSYSAKVDLRFLTGKPIDELLHEISALPPHSIVLTTFFFQDSSGQFFRTEDVLDMITREARVPIYGIYSSYIGHGIVGGCIVNPEVTGRKIADLAGAVLNGENARKIPFVLDDSGENTVDWRELKRWGISERRLPPSTVQLFRQPSVWERYRIVVLAIIAFIVLQSVLILGLIVNIRRRRRAEKDLLREKTVSDAVIESLPGVFVLQDRDRNVRWNRNAETKLRHKPSEVTPLGNIAEQHQEQVRAAREQVLEDGSGQFEADLLLRNGKTAPFYVSAQRVDLEGKPYFTAIGLDLTERERTRQALRDSEAALRSFIENAPYGIATIDVRRDRFVYANPAMIKLLGYESLAQLCDLTLSRELSSQGAHELFRTLTTRGESFKDVEFTWKSKDAKTVAVRASGRRISREDGDVLEITAEDVTAHRSLEDQLRHAQKLEALGQLSGSVAHDFNNLLSVIIGYSEILSSDADLQGVPKTQLETIKRAAERAAALTSQLLAFSRRQVLQPSVINLNSLVRETERMLHRLMPEDLHQEIELDPVLWKTKADPNQIVQVIMNLAVNARDAMPKGGTLRIQTANVALQDGAVIDGVEIPAGDYVKLSVTDTGTGMSSETRARIFEPFFTTKEPGKGTGLGLATVYGIVKQSGGFIFVDSRLGAGTTCTVYLPRFEQAPAPNAIERGNGRATVANNSETLLVVEDEAAFRDLLRDGLQAKGFNVLVAANGVEALRMADEYGHPIRLLITDVIMPQMSGPELARALRATGDIDVLYMTGYADDKLDDLSESGELALLRKPFYLDELLGKIFDVLTQTSSSHQRENK